MIAYPNDKLKTPSAEKKKKCKIKRYKIMSPNWALFTNITFISNLEIQVASNSKA
jgi:hypothetical protein